MAVGPLASLGANSGVLTDTVINKLKEYEENNRIKLYTNKIEKNTEKQKALAELITKISSFKTNVSSLGDATAFAQRQVTASVTGDTAAASLSVSSGVSLQSMSVSVTQIAQKDTFQSGGIKAGTDRVLQAGQNPSSFTLVQNGKTYTVRVDANTTYQDLADRINSVSDGKIQAKIINTGESGNPYRFTLSSKDTGLDSSISFVDGDGTKDSTSGNYTTDANSTAILKNLGWELDKSTANGDKGYSLIDPNGEYHIKKAQNAEFSLDGIKMIRQSNEVKDIGAGLTLTLKKTGDIDFTVKQDTEGLKKTLEDLAQTYNELMTSLDDLTKFDTETGVTGTLQGVSEITRIRSDIFSIMSKTKAVEGTMKDKNDNSIKTKVMLSLQDFGLTTNEIGVMSFKSATFDEKIGKDPDLAERFFAGTNGFKDINVVGKSVDLNQDINFTTNSFKIKFNDTTYDLSKTKDGQPFELKGNTPQERAQKLLDHINSFQIEDLKATIQTLNLGANGTSYVLKFNSDNGSDFEITGDKNMLEKIGLEETKVSPEIEQGTGVFAELKKALDGMTDRKTGTLTMYDKNLTTENKKLTESKESTQKSIDARYDTMTEKFIRYELILSKLQNQSSQLIQMINAMNNTNK